MRDINFDIDLEKIYKVHVFRDARVYRNIEKSSVITVVVDPFLLSYGIKENDGEVWRLKG